MHVQKLDCPQRATLRDDSLAAVLSRDFFNDPSLTYAIPEENARRIVSHWLFRAALRAGRLYGEIHATRSAAAAAVWVRPEYDISLLRMVHAGLTAMPFNLDSGTIRRCMKLGAHVEAIRKRLAPQPHWYLMALGADPSQPERTIGEALIEPVVWRADSMRVPCYLEAFNENRLAFYKKYGFRIAGAGCIPGGGPNVWGMTRGVSY